MESLRFIRISSKIWRPAGRKGGGGGGASYTYTSVLLWEQTDDKPLEAPMLELTCIIFIELRYFRHYTDSSSSPGVNFQAQVSLSEEAKKALISLSSAPPSPPRLSVAERSGALFPLEHRNSSPGSTNATVTSFPSNPLHTSSGNIGPPHPPLNSSSDAGLAPAVTTASSARLSSAPEQQPPSQAALAEGVALSLRTITEQQLVIKSLQDLVQATKGRVAYLEEINRSLVQEKGAQQEVPPLLKEELDTLRRTNVQLLQRTSLLLEEKTLLQDQLDSAHVALQDLESRYQQQLLQSKEYQSKEERWKQQTALLRLSETERKKLQIENVELREDLDRSAFEKKRWRALVQTLACRLHPSLNTHIEKHINTMVMEEERRYQASVLLHKQRQAELVAEMEAAAAANAEQNAAKDDEAFGSTPSEMDTGGEGRSTQAARKAFRQGDMASPMSSQQYSDFNSMNVLAVWQKPKESSSPFSPDSLSSKHAPDSSGATTTASGEPSQVPSPSRGTITNVPFNQEQALPQRPPGSKALGIYEEDPMYDFGPGTLPISMLPSRGVLRRGVGPSGGPLSTKSFSDILQPEERKRKQQEEGRKVTVERNIIPLGNTTLCPTEIQHDDKISIGSFEAAGVCDSFLSSYGFFSLLISIFLSALFCLFVCEDEVSHSWFYATRIISFLCTIFQSTSCNNFLIYFVREVVALISF
eukprot:gene1122-657_t